MGKVISFSNHKGGVGKSCSCVNLGAGISNFGKHGKQVVKLGCSTPNPDGEGLNGWRREARFMTRFLVMDA